MATQVDEGFHGELVDVVALILPILRLLQHLICDGHELFYVHRQANLLGLSQIVESTEELLAAGLERCLRISIDVSLHQFEKEHLGRILEEGLVLRQLRDGVDVRHDALIKFNLVAEGEVNTEGIPESLHVAELFTLRNLLNIHHIVEAEEGVDVDARLQVSRQLQRLLDEADGFHLFEDLASVVLLMNSRDHLRQESECVRH